MSILEMAQNFVSDLTSWKLAAFVAVRVNSSSETVAMPGVPLSRNTGGMFIARGLNQYQNS